MLQWATRFQREALLDVDGEELTFTTADLFHYDERFVKKLSIASEGDCWIWLGGKCRSGKNHSKEYGRIYVLGSGKKNQKMVYTHRLVYTYFYGEIPYGWEVHHTCFNSLCCNPNHLTAVDADAHDILHGYTNRRTATATAYSGDPWAG